jgi:putative pyruvate formate lyase activating enzyme
MTLFEPAYIKTYNSGLLNRKIEEANEALRNCKLCPRECEVDRYASEKGICKTGAMARVVTYLPHFGEELPLRGTKGSGTIFFASCSLLCNFCQNYHITHKKAGNKVSDNELAEIMISLQNDGCHNISFVTPSHVVPQILSALKVAIAKGLKIPLVYDTSAYDSIKALKLLEDIIDIYMPDFKFWNPETAKLTCNARNYPEAARKAIIEMHRQVGDLVINEAGLAERGLLIRHLALPKGLADTPRIMEFIANEISPQSYVNIMPQYRPCGKSSKIPELAVSIRKKEFEAALKDAEKAGITRLENQEYDFLL